MDFFSGDFFSGAGGTSSRSPLNFDVGEGKEGTGEDWEPGKTFSLRRNSSRSSIGTSGLGSSIRWIAGTGAVEEAAFDAGGGIVVSLRAAP